MTERINGIVALKGATLLFFFILVIVSSVSAVTPGEDYIIVNNGVMVIHPGSYEWTADAKAYGRWAGTLTWREVGVWTEPIRYAWAEGTWKMDSDGETYHWNLGTKDDPYSWRLLKIFSYDPDVRLNTIVGDLYFDGIFVEHVTTINFGNMRTFYMPY